MSTSSSLRRKLKSLEYPDYTTFNISNLSEVSRVLLWLEEGKLRHYEPAQREPFRQTVLKPKQFLSLIPAYLTSLGTPKPVVKLLSDYLDSDTHQAGALSPVLEWICSAAIKAEYQEKSTLFRQYARSSFQKQATDYDNAGSGDQSGSFLRVAWSLLTPICELLQLPPPEGCANYSDLFNIQDNKLSGPLDDIVFAYFAEVARRISNDLPQFFRTAEAHAAQTIIFHAQTSISETSEQPQNLEETMKSVLHSSSALDQALKKASDFAAMDTSSDKLNASIGMLRSLYNYDIKSLQLSVNRVISTAQDLTAKPEVQAHTLPGRKNH